MIICSLALVWASCSHNETKQSDNNPTASDERAFSIYAVKEQTVGTTLRLPAELSPYEDVNIYPRVTGYIKNIPVDIGTTVKQGQVLMEMEAPEVMQNSLAAEAAYIKAQASFNASKDTYYRLLNISKTPGTVSPNDLQLAQSKMQSDSAMCNSEKATWMAMETMNDYLIVKAPFDGTITQRNIDPGSLVTIANKTESKPMLELQQISKLRLQVKVPETFAPQLQNNQEVSFIVEALPGKTFSGVISRQANSLDDKYRSELVEIDVQNPDHVLMSGMYAEVLLPLSGHPNTCVVPQAAVVTSTERKYVIKIQNHKTVWVDVTTGNSENGMIEIFGDIKTGDSIIGNANEEIKEGQIVK